jgi:hypothetical protein
MRIAFVYDCLYPYTVGGAERRYRSLVAQLAQRHDVTYVTRRQWQRGLLACLAAATPSSSCSISTPLGATASRWTFSARHRNVAVVLGSSTLEGAK